MMNHLFVLISGKKKERKNKLKERKSYVTIKILFS